MLYEDFAKFTDGTEYAPGAAVPLERTYHVPASMTAEDGWIGLGLYQAGRTCMIGACTGGLNPYGYTGTPGMDLGGKATLTLRARRAAGSIGNIDVMVIGEYGPGEDEIPLTLTDEWQTYTFTAVHAEFGEKSHFQIDANGFKGLAIVLLAPYGGFILVYYLCCQYALYSASEGFIKPLPEAVVDKAGSIVWSRTVAHVAYQSHSVGHRIVIVCDVLAITSHFGPKLRPASCMSLVGQYLQPYTGSLGSGEKCRVDLAQRVVLPGVR